MVKRFNQRVYRFEGYRLDAAPSMLYRDELPISLPPKAIETLLALVEQSGKIIPTEELMQTIWNDSIVEESNLSLYLHQLRKILGETKDGKPFIETFKRRGYRFNGEVTVIGADMGSNSSSDQPRLPSRRRSNLGYIFAAAFVTVLSLVFFLIWFNGTSVTRSAAKEDLKFLTLTSDEDVNFATISPNGNYFAYSSHDGDKVHLWMQQIGQSTRVEIVTPFAGAIHSTTFAPDSESVYFVAVESPELQPALYRVPFLGGVKIKILSNVGGPVSFSPDSREMIFSRRDPNTRLPSLVIASIDGTKERTLDIEGGADSIYSGAWSPDGMLIASCIVRPGERENTIVGIDPSNGATKQLSPEKWDNCFRIAWTRDARGLAFVGTKFNEGLSTRRDQIYFLFLPDGRSRLVTFDGSRHQPASLGITNTDEILAVPFNRLSQIWAMNASGEARTAIQITRGSADGRGGVAALADGRVAYLTRHGDGFTFWVMNADGSERKQITTDPPEIEELRSDPTGRFFIFSAYREKSSHLYRVDANGSNLLQLTFGETTEIDSTVSPDGNWVVFNSYVSIGGLQTSFLWKIPSGGGESVKVSNIECSAPHFSPNGQYVSCISAESGKILVISVETGAVIHTFLTPENSLLNIGARWRSDGKDLTYIVNNKGISNIWSQRIDAPNPLPLTNFTSGEIYNFDFSIDGSWLYVARGNPIRNAITIKNFR